MADKVWDKHSQNVNHLSQRTAVDTSWIYQLAFFLWEARIESAG